MALWVPKRDKSCHVCHDVAPNHIHYGGISCYSCRAFFRRTCLNRQQVLLSCQTKQCKISATTRTRCRYCRYQLCLSAGMSPLLVKSDRNKKLTLDTSKQTLDTWAQLHQQMISDLPTASSSGNSLLPSTAPAMRLDVVHQDVTRILQQDKNDK